MTTPDVIEITLKLLEDGHIRCPICSKVIEEDMKIFDLIKCKYCLNFLQVMDRTGNSLKIEVV